LKDSKTWLTSKETKFFLKISDCKLMHLRLEGKIEFKKERGAFFYNLESIS
jgi:hypothetical protein